MTTLCQAAETINSRCRVILLIYTDYFLGSYLLMKLFWKLLHICQVMTKTSSVLFICVVGVAPLRKIVAVIAAVAENESSWEHQTLDWPEVFEYWCRRWMMYKATQLVNDIFLPHVAENTGIGPITSRICRYLEQDIYLYIIESTVTSRIVIDTEFVINTTMPATFQHR